MIGKQGRGQRSLMIPGSIDDFIPEDHILKKVDKVLDLSWLRDEVRDCYSEDFGRPGIDPESALRLMLAGFFQGIVHDRKLIREAQVNLAIRWFAGYDLDDKLPDHSTLSRLRKRWGAARFRRVFLKTVELCAAAGLVSGETVHADATLIRADVSWESMTTDYADMTYEANPAEDDSEDNDDIGGKRSLRRKKPKKRKRKSKTDPDATLTTSSRSYRMEPSYKQHTAVDDKAGVIVDVECTTGEVSEGGFLMEVIDRVEIVTGKPVERITADSGYSHPTNYEALEQCGADAIIPPQNTGRTRSAMPITKFKYDAKHDVVHCPAGKKLRRKSRGQNGWFYRATGRDCAGCRMRKFCVPKTAKSRSILIVNGYPSLLRARRRKRKGWDEETRRFYGRHRWLVEGVHGEAKTQHGLARAARRGIENVSIQVYLTAAVINLKRLAAFLSSFLLGFTPEFVVFKPSEEGFKTFYELQHTSA